MLISRRYRFIFIHIRKTGGTSISSALIPFSSTRFEIILNCILKRFNIMRFEPKPYFKHSSAYDIISMMGQSNYESFFSFAFVRNPWDWQVSQYEYAIRVRGREKYKVIKSFSNFDEYIKWRCKEKVFYQKDLLYSKDGKKLVNYIGRFETLESDFKHVCNRIGISATLPCLNVSKRKHFKEYYNSETARLVEKAFKPDIELFNFNFD